MGGSMAWASLRCALAALRPEPAPAIVRNSETWDANDTLPMILVARRAKGQSISHDSSCDEAPSRVAPDAGAVAAVPALCGAALLCFLMLAPTLAQGASVDRDELWSFPEGLIGLPDLVLMMLTLLEKYMTIA